MTPTLTVTPGQRPLSAWSVADQAGGLEDRAPALLRLDAGVRRAAPDVQPQVEDPLARRDDVAVRPGALEDECDVHPGRDRADVRRATRRADLLVRVGDEGERLERQATPLADERP